MYFNTKADFTEGKASYLPRLIAISGFTIDILLFYVIFSIYNIKNRAVHIAKEITHDLEMHSQRLQTLTRLQQLISSSLDMDAVLREIADAVIPLTGAVMGHFRMVDEETQTLRSCNLQHEPEAPVLREIPFGQGGVGWVARHRQPLNISDTRYDERFKQSDWWHQRGFYSYLALPILFEDSLLAVMSLRGKRPFILTPEDQILLNNLMSQAAVAIHHAAMYASQAEAHYKLRNDTSQQ